MTTHPTAGFATFETFELDGVDAADTVVGLLTDHLRTVLRGAPGFVSARLHISFDGAVVVRLVEWRSEAAWRDVDAGGPAALPAVRRTTYFAGRRTTGLVGPDEGKPATVAVVATRHLAGHDAAQAVLELLSDSGERKRTFPGFISATPYLSDDGTMLVNYPQWVDESAFQAWMADPQIAGARDKVTQYELAPPDIVICRVHTRIDEPAAIGDGRRWS
jgi:quinol monooxygenase YgiN